MNEFGNRLKKIRIEKNMSQKDFANRANIDKSMMCRYENGEKRPTYEALCSIAREHNISLDYLCGLQQSGTVSLIGLTDGQAAVPAGLSAPAAVPAENMTITALASGEV